MTSGKRKISMTALATFEARIRRRLSWEASRLGLWLNDRVTTRLHDMRARPSPTPGAVMQSRRLAIYAIYPRTGLLPSHFRALRHLNRQGYAPIVVSSLPLSEADLALLHPLAWQIMIRPNFGYDIGGYRAVILWLGERLTRLDRLLLTNDSVFWPLGRGRDWLEIATAMPSAPDLVGAISNCGRIPGTDWGFDETAADFHYCSFALSLGPAILSDADFQGFWYRMRLSDRKVQMVERGEVALSQWAIRAGYSHAACWDRAGFAERLSLLTDTALMDLATRLILPEDPGLRERRASLTRAKTPPDRATMIGFILNAVAETGPAYALPAFALAEDGFGFLKKSPLRLDAEGRAVTLTLLSDDLELLAEARQLIPSADAAGLAAHGGMV
ncbi:MAG: rhamnan synthesis F family protein [Paracoccus sp. (in: a-proteobacteria)]|nr:rhamnan synthesis F family protein [Paracoccus sp. (in: a-proteobacteria)]